jgi:NAD-dependent SIR2 family protein deacetylase
MNIADSMAQAVDWLREADGMLITAGAGMGVDSGLPDFRGEDGFWRAYPALKAQGLRFDEIASPAALKSDPRLAWGFYGHRLALYRKTVPHEGFDVLKRWANRMPNGAFVFTSNVDGQFQKAGFSEDRIQEVHGTIHLLQCIDDCRGETWAAEGFEPEVDVKACQLINEPPKCPHCGAPARPNILMFGDWKWVDTHSNRQYDRLQAWLGTVKRPVVVEMGAGRAIPTVRRMSELNKPRVIRINPRDFAINPAHGVGIPGGAKEILSELDRRLSSQ